MRLAFAMLGGVKKEGGAKGARKGLEGFGLGLGVLRDDSWREGFYRLPLGFDKSTKESHIPKYAFPIIPALTSRLVAIQSLKAYNYY